MNSTYGAEQFAAEFAVSRETMESLQRHHDLLIRWNRRINLVSRHAEASLWRRHFADSAQLLTLRPASCRHWADLGSGAGFPALVLAAMLDDTAAPPKITLVESDARKAAFLGEAARLMGVAVEIKPERIEALAPLHADVVSARALAPLDDLLKYLALHRSPDGIGLFLKGETVHKEIGIAERSWRFAYRAHPSVTDANASVLEVGAVSRV